MVEKTIDLYFSMTQQSTQEQYSIISFAVASNSIANLQLSSKGKKKGTSSSNQQLQHLFPRRNNLLSLLRPHSLIITRIKTQLLPGRRLHEEVSTGESQINRLVHNPHINTTSQHHLEVSSALIAAVTTIAHDHGWLVLPLVEQVVNGVLQPCRDAPVVLGRHKDEAVEGSDGPSPHARVLVLVVLDGKDARRDGWFVVEGQVECRHVDELQRDFRVRRRGGLVRFDGLEDEIGDLWACPADALGANDDSDFVSLRR